jgi:hypothetical protein
MQETTSNVDQHETTIASLWHEPVLTILDADDAETGFVNVGGDNGVYS